jgi:hypothetical protein
MERGSLGELIRANRGGRIRTDDLLDPNQTL